MLRLSEIEERGRGEEERWYVGPPSRGFITQPSPGLVVCLVGWLVLLLPIILVIVSALAK